MMTIEAWIALGIWFAAQITAVIITYVNVRVKIKELEINLEAAKETIKVNLHSFHIHERQNENSFDKFDKKIDNVYNSINDVKNILMNK
ncbi:MAG: hypothetical protein ACFFD1_00830 [Candidatus Thorarchaeota archaeon]